MPLLDLHYNIKHFHNKKNGYQNVKNGVSCWWNWDFFFLSLSSVFLSNTPKFCLFFLSCICVCCVHVCVGTSMCEVYMQSGGWCQVSGIFLNCSCTLFFEARPLFQTQSSLIRLVSLASLSAGNPSSPYSEAGSVVGHYSCLAFMQVIRIQTLVLLRVHFYCRATLPGIFF